MVFAVIGDVIGLLLLGMIPAVLLVGVLGALLPAALIGFKMAEHARLTLDRIIYRDDA